MNRTRPCRLALVASAVFCLAASVASLPVRAQPKPPVKIGVITPLTGPLGSYGKSQELMLKLAVEDVNAAGGINGSPLQLDIGDSQTDPGQAVLLLRKYFKEGHFAVVGPMTGTQWETVSPLANQLNMPAVSVNATKPGITVRPWTIRLMTPDDTLMPDGVKAFLATHPKVKKVVITADVREASSKASADSYVALARQLGLQVLETVEFSSRATDMSAIAIQIKSRNPDAILAAAFPAQAMLLAKDLTVQGVSVPVLNTTILWAGPFINNVGDNGRHWNVIGFSTNEAGPPGHSDAAIYGNLVRRAQQRADATTGQPFNLANWPVSYDGVLFLADAMRRAGIDGATDAKQAREAIKNQFIGAKSFSGAFRYTFRDTGDGHIPAGVLSADVDKKVWRFAPAAAR